MKYKKVETESWFIPELSRLLELPLDNASQLSHCLKAQYSHVPAESQISVVEGKKDAEAKSNNEVGEYRYWCHATYLQPDSSGIRVAAATSYSSNIEKQKLIVQQLNSHFADQSIDFFLEGKEIKLKTSRKLPDSWASIFDIINQNLFSVIKNNDPNTLEWLSLVNESQMLFAEPAIIDSRSSSMSHSTMSMHGIWVSPIPDWLESVNIHQESFFVKGAQLYLQQDPQELELWLGQLLARLIKLRSNSPASISDGKNTWRKKSLQQWLLRLRSLFKMGES
ncbi:hypothetical protein [Pleionea sediminis]|uniref:hypothetical protein n=1 Tax=Pleionea sediminis TaxID=2569479 RepID=UPI001184B723|nr:hypothetical protein [Pleionea sediminis]